MSELPMYGDVHSDPHRASVPPPRLGGVLRTRPAVVAVQVAPTVSVVVPHHNYGGYLPAAVHSALDQPGVEVDVVIVDDASDDGSVEVARALASSDARVRLVEKKVNQGPVATFNDGLALAEGRYLVRLDADDMLTPSSLSRAVQLLEAHPSVGLAYGHPLHFVSTVPRARQHVRSWTLWPGREWLERRCRLGYNCITSPEVVMRTDVVDRVGGQRPLDHTHDMEMWMRLAAVSDVGHLDGPDQAYHREHGASRSASQVDELTDFRERALAFDTLFAWMTDQLGEGQQLWQETRRVLAAQAVGRALHELDRGRGGNELVDRLTAFAVELSPDVRTGPAFQRLLAVRSRRRPPSGIAPPQIARSLARRARADWARRRWHRTGV